MSQRKPHSLRPPIPSWLRILGVVGLTAIGATLAYAVAIAIVNLPRIGV